MRSVPIRTHQRINASRWWGWGLSAIDFIRAKDDPLALAHQPPHELTQNLRLWVGLANDHVAVADVDFQLAEGDG